MASAKHIVRRAKAARTASLDKPLFKNSRVTERHLRWGTTGLAGLVGGLGGSAIARMLGHGSALGRVAGGAIGALGSMGLMHALHTARPKTQRRLSRTLDAINMGTRVMEARNLYRDFRAGR